MQNDTYLIAVRIDWNKGKFTPAKRKINTLASTGKTVDVNGQRFLKWNWLNRPEINRPDLDMWPVVVYGVNEDEANRRLANLFHDYKADGLEYQPAHEYEVKNP